MTKVNTYPIKLKSEGGIRFVFDNIRKKWLKLTPEEKVRQFFIRYLVEKKGYPASLIASEMGLNINGLKRRADIVIYKNAEPYIIVECKAESVKIGQATVEQAANYNRSLQVEYIAITNGSSAYFIKNRYEEDTFEMVRELPDFEK